MLFLKQDFYIWMTGKQTWLPLITQMRRAMKKILLKRGEAWLKPENSTESYLYPFAQKLTVSPSAGLLLAGTSPSLLLDTLDASGSSFFDTVGPL